MTKGIILQSASFEKGGDAAREQHLEEVLEGAGYEAVEVEPEVPAGPEGDSATLAGQEPPPSKGSRRQRAIERATAPLHEKIRQLEAGRAQPAAQAEAAERPKPNKEDFANYEAYEDALLSWGTQKAIRDKAVADAQIAERQFYEQNLRNYGAQAKEAKGKYKDWDEVVNQDIFIGREAQLTILEQENGAEVIYYLGKNPDYAKKLGEMRPISAIRAVERLSARLTSGEGYEDRRPRPRVPAPVRTVSTGGSTAAPGFADIAARPNYPGKARDLKRALAEQ